MKCLETRHTPEGLKRRRYRTDDGRTIQTLEVPLPVLRTITTMCRIRERMEGWQRAQAGAARRLKAKVLLAQGIKPLAVAHEVGISTRYAQRLKAAA